MQIQPENKPAKGLGENQIAWCDKYIRNFHTMRMQAELSASQREQRPAVPVIQEGNV